jgi:hypothetical protein
MEKSCLFISPPKLFNIFRQFVLNGGLIKWCSENLLLVLVDQI